MPFEIPENIHPNCARLAWLIGTWAGNGHGEYPTIEPLPVRPGADLPAGRPAVHPLHVSRAWIVDADGNHVREAAQETGFIRPQEDGTLEVVMTHNLGFVEIWHGEIHPDAAALRDRHRRGRAHRHRQGVRRRQAALRLRQRRPALRLRHGGDGPGAPAAHPRAAGAAVTEADRDPTWHERLRARAATG